MAVVWVPADSVDDRDVILGTCTRCGQVRGVTSKCHICRKTICCVCTRECPLCLEPLCDEVMYADARDHWIETGCCDLLICKRCAVGDYDGDALCCRLDAYDVECVACQRWFDISCIERMGGDAGGYCEECYEANKDTMR